MGLSGWLLGIFRIQITSADVPGLLRVLGDENIRLYNLTEVDEMTVRFMIDRRNLTQLQEICRKQGAAVKILGRSGIYWKCVGFLRRPVLVMGLIFLLCLLWWLPSRVLFVRVQGNATVPARQILAAAEDWGISFGANRKEVRSERVKNGLLESIPQLQWAGVNSYGCMTVITVREKATVQEELETAGVSSMVASTDGIILSATATAGTLQCQPGQAVREGDILISGLTDCGLCLRGTRAQGEVYAATRHCLTVISPAIADRLGEIRDTWKGFSLIIGKNRINLWKGSGKRGGTCGRMYVEYYIKLPGGFRLPAAIAVEFYTLRQETQAEMDPEASMKEFAGDYLLNGLVAGTITSRQDAFSRRGDVCVLKSSFLCTEMICRPKPEGIGDLHG